MYLTLIGVVLLVLKWLEFGPVADLGWPWVLLPFGLAFMWFEFGERIFGYDKRRVEHAENEERRKERVAKQFAPPRAGRKQKA